MFRDICRGLSIDCNEMKFYEGKPGPPAEYWFVLSHRRLLLMVFGQWMLSILLFINTCIFLMMVVIVLQVLILYSRTDCFDVHIED
ncbi:unnamed protein product [Schistosoma margrebowiei]|uniref:Uncharacterized protein n=1 Tax=Schistosoma margrebowiei TaxID=48269 RepID=A0A183L899_9TREM|nr:unnamed protein product [Schistosoma margrebowiei]